MKDQKAVASPSDIPRGPRNALQTKERILLAAIDEFCEHGYAGTSTTRIMSAAGCNIRMLYHYFDSKEGLYLAALTRVYQDVRRCEASTNFWNLPPRQGIIALTQFTFDYMLKNPSFPRMIINENLNKGRAAVNIAEAITSASKPLVRKVDDLIAQGHASGEFRSRPDALQLYMTILGLSFIHITNRFTLTTTFGVDVASDAFLMERRSNVTQAVLGLLYMDVAQRDTI
jgi:AcrR family transcriptional regulator